MKENKFVSKFEGKSTKDLERIALDKDFFVLEAREAAIDLLATREISNENYNILKETLEKDRAAEIKEKKVVEIQKTVRKGKQFLTDDISAPQMHSKRVIVVFSALFATIFGTVLLLYNMKQVKSKEGYQLTLVFGVLYTVLIIILANLVEIPRIGLFMNLIGGLILTEYFWNKFIGEQTAYRKRSWVKPLIISIIICIPFVLAIFYTS